MFFKPVYILILFFTIIVDYYAGIYIEKSSSQKIKKRYLTASIIANVGILALFKYYNFLNENLQYLLGFIKIEDPLPFLSILLPIGLSFHTFQAMSYTIEVYRGNQKAEKHFGIYSLYVMFYPQLVAGPIERPQNILHQFHEKKSFNEQNLITGLRQILWGLFKKTVVADRLAILVDNIHNTPQEQNGLTLILGAILFSFQIYCDFSGYSDIALGSAKTMGYNLMTNFNLPFFSKSITEFWRRWHISLSTWFNDYLFSALNFKWRNHGKAGLYLALFTTFFISGLWHGAGWTFIIYGSLHGIIIIYETVTKKWRKKFQNRLPAWIANSFYITLTFLFVSFSWIFFRSPNLSYALTYIKNIFTLTNLKIDYLRALNITPPKFIITMGILWVFLAIENTLFKNHKTNFLLKLPQPIRWTVYLITILCILIIGQHNHKEFIYFQF